MLSRYACRSANSIVTYVADSTHRPQCLQSYGTLGLYRHKTHIHCVIIHQTIYNFAVTCNYLTLSINQNYLEWPSRHAVFYSRMCSGMGRNVQYYCEHFGVCDIDLICSSKQWKLQADIDMDIRAGMIRELGWIMALLWGCFCTWGCSCTYCLSVCRLILLIFFIFSLF